MATIMFGSFMCTLGGSGCKPVTVVEPSAMAQEPVKKQLNRALLQMQKEEAERNKAWVALEEKCVARAAIFEGGTFKKCAKGFVTIKPKSQQVREKEELEKRLQVEEERAFQNMAQVDVIGITIAGGYMPSRGEPITPSRKVATSKKAIKKKQPRAIYLPRERIQELIIAIGKIARRRDMTIECISERASNKVHVTGGRAYVQLKHHKGERKPVDMKTDEFGESCIFCIAQSCRKNKVNLSQLTFGDSGLVLLNPCLDTPCSRFKKGLIVRGNHEGKIIDARVRLSWNAARTIIQYSSVASKYWEGFSEGFQEGRPAQIHHVCRSDLDVRKCGKVAGLVYQAMFQFGKITCLQCIENYNKRAQDDLADSLITSAERLKDKIQQEGPDFEHMSSALQTYQKGLRGVNKNMVAFAEVQRLIGSQVEAPFTHIVELNSILLKGFDMLEDDYVRCSTLLLELARYQKNRTENIKKGSLLSFRNKVSAKAHINMTLMCDNQLDANGNFLWGQRQYHSKRLFANRFKVVDPADGYKAHLIRKSPNCERKLAIGNLIVSTNFETVRRRMKGEEVVSPGLTKSCVSMMNGNYIYPCCCVTFDDGQPIKSPLYTPTKHHLVIGNTGDSKLIDLPETITDTLHIVEDGYCYIHIFLAMLVNVDEKDAKDFTKKVRDLAVAQLGKWPTLIDVATACAMLTVFAPATRTAEIPRILVDHVSQTMHVLDSFGSLSTNYHILKANTIGQLIQFASDDLESEMKHYQVGGLVNPDEHDSKSVKILIRSVYKPKLLEQVLMEEPYLLVFAMVSPCVLMALFNSGSLERATQLWIRGDNDLTFISSALSTLAQKVSISRSLLDQLDVINETASPLLDRIFVGTKPNVSYMLAINFLTRLKNRRESDESLNSLGFRNLTLTSCHFVEKNYAALLELEWNALSWLEKCSLTYHSQRHAWRYSITLLPAKTADFGGRYSASAAFALARFGSKTSSKMSSLMVQCHDGIRSRLRRTVCKSINLVRFLFPEFMTFLNTLVVIAFVVKIFSVINQMILEHRVATQQVECGKTVAISEKVSQLHKIYMTGQGEKTAHGFVEYVRKMSPDLLDEAVSACNLDGDEEVQHQSKRADESKFEAIIAFIALVLMIFDAERSDCVYRSLTKLKSLVSTTEVTHQSLDDIKTSLTEEKMTIDFELGSMDMLSSEMKDHTFQTWWDKQITSGRTVPHYRTEGHQMDFTRDTAASVACEIARLPKRDILLRGTVGSGKSTGLPHLLMKHGKVLMLEPTRPLAENVARQLRGAPFHTNATLRMRGYNHFGSSPITIMTSGFALHFFANNPDDLRRFDFVLIDECHVMDSSAIAFNCMLHAYSYQGKLVKMSATPPGRECEFVPQHKVDIKVEDSLSFQNFVSLQGTGANADVVQNGDNILVYVASYNEVDTLTQLLTAAGHKVTKVDGRTMKTGNIEIVTSGTPSKKHFIVATNIVENGVTLDVDVVVDFGQKVVPEVDSDSRLIRYKKINISYGERIQRLGRVGRNKRGTALRIGHTEKGLAEIPPVIATEAALACFAYGFPVSTQGVTTQLLAECTVKQTLTMMQFELSPFYMANLVRFDGSMHAAIHKILKPFKLRDSEIVLNKRAIPVNAAQNWLSVTEYRMCGVHLSLEDNVRMPFYIKDIPERVSTDIWEAVCVNKSDAGFGRVSSASACKIAYTLQTDAHALPRTIKILDALIIAEQTKKEHFDSQVGNICSSSMFSLSSITQALRARYNTNHAVENLSILQTAKDSLLEFKNLNLKECAPDVLEPYGVLEAVHHQSENDMARHLKLKGRWNKHLISRDILIMLAVCGGGIWMAYEHLTKSFADVRHQGKESKRKKQKLRFRDAHDKKMGREVYGDDDTIEQHFGEAYTKKGRQSGRTRGTGTKTRKFINMYGYDPKDYEFIRFVDPLTGATKDESAYVDIQLVQEHFGEIRSKYIDDDLLEAQAIRLKPGIQAFYVNNATKKALQVDLTPHIPLLACSRSNTIAGFPEREGELRQTGQAIAVSIDVVPGPNEVDVHQNEEAVHEGKSILNGLRDYNPIAASVCLISNNSDGVQTRLFGIGFGGYLIVNQHLFKRNNGCVTIKSHHGEFVVRNSTTLKIAPCQGRDIALVRLPKDCPPFPQRLQFRQPEEGEKVCMVGSNFQEKSISSTISEASTVRSISNSHFWQHWISTKEGYCGLPVVAVKDGAIVGLHSLANNNTSVNYFTDFPINFREMHLKTPESLEWVNHWKYNPDNIAWGNLKLVSDLPAEPFKISKLVTDLQTELVRTQGFTERKWMYDALEGNLKAVGSCPGQLVTKHVVNGKCVLFDQYLATHPLAREFFKPMLGAYQKSRLNREAYIKDQMKYSKPIVIGDVDCTSFERALSAVIVYMEKKGFTECEFVTNHETILAALNMKAAVGAIYAGKKRDYFEGMSEAVREQHVFESCKRLYLGKLGIWNGSLKAELRVEEKVLANKTRTFTAAPLDTLLGGKVCVDDFNNQFYSRCIDMPWTVGMTKFYGGWNELMSKLPDGWVYVDADGSQFDSSLSPYLINAVLNIRLHFMEEWDVGIQMLKNLYTEILYTPIATPDGTIIKKFKGNNSGQPSTVVDNTLMVVLAMYYSFEMIGMNLATVHEHCIFYANGDDLIIAIEPQLEAHLDKFQGYFAQLGLSYEFDSRTRNKTDLWFMSHQAKVVDGIMIPKLEKERIVSILEWDRASKPEHRLEAICASMIESWGYADLTHEIRKFYQWVLEQAPYNTLALQGKAPYIAESALRRLYTTAEPSSAELSTYIQAIMEHFGEEEEVSYVSHQADNEFGETIDAGMGVQSKDKMKVGDQPTPRSSPSIGVEDTSSGKMISVPDRDIDAGSALTVLPRLARRNLSSKMVLPMVKGKPIINLDHLIKYEPAQIHLSNTRASQDQFTAWYEALKDVYELNDEQMSVLMNGLMVWCIENGTSSNLVGMWTMMEGEVQVTYPLKPVIENAKPTFRQIMAHFSDAAEAYIEMRNAKEPYMPRYGIQRNLRDYSLARYAFDFYEITSRTTQRAREAHHQMKAAAIGNRAYKMFGMDGKVGSQEEDTERHTTSDVNKNMHSLLGMRGM
uniref:Genome polyprotein n=1 Tax=Ethiopian yam virus TaxID=3123104 RepID=A0AAU6NE54_9POTV